LRNQSWSVVLIELSPGDKGAAMAVRESGAVDNSKTDSVEKRLRFLDYSSSKGRYIAAETPKHGKEYFRSRQHSGAH